MYIGAPVIDIGAAKAYIGASAALIGETGLLTHKKKPEPQQHRGRTLPRCICRYIGGSSRYISAPVVDIGAATVYIGASAALIGETGLSAHKKSPNHNNIVAGLFLVVSAGISADPPGISAFPSSISAQQRHISALHPHISAKQVFQLIKKARTTTTSWPDSSS